MAEVSLRPMSLRPGGGAGNPFAKFGKGAAPTKAAKVRTPCDGQREYRLLDAAERMAASFTDPFYVRSSHHSMHMAFLHRLRRWTLQIW